MIISLLSESEDLPAFSYRLVIKMHLFITQINLLSLYRLQANYYKYDKKKSWSRVIFREIAQKNIARSQKAALITSHRLFVKLFLPKSCVKFCETTEFRHNWIFLVLSQFEFCHNLIFLILSQFELSFVIIWDEFYYNKKIGCVTNWIWILLPF